MITAPADWYYFSEGGKHVIFTCRHLALRVEKASLARAAAAFACYKHSDSQQNDDRYELLETTDTSSPHSMFSRFIVEPNLGKCYIDAPKNLLLPEEFCSCLHYQAMSCGKIPTSRVTSWQVDTQSNKTELLESTTYVRATLLRNCAQLKTQQKSMQYYSENPITISVEIKPKAGYLSSSPLVLPTHRCKYYRSRYNLQQELMEKNVVEKGWCRDQLQFVDDSTTNNQSGFKRSSYSPLDLFSRDHARIRSAVMELSKNMQNNFRVWCNGEKVFGEYDRLSPVEYYGLLSRMIGTKHCNVDVTDSGSILLHLVANVVSDILYREKLLDELLELQLLDVIDSDGAVLVYDRLVYLVNGSQSEAELALEQHFTASDEAPVYNKSSNSSRQEISLLSSPYPMPHCRHLHELLNDIRQFQSELQNQRASGQSIDESIANKYHSDCLHHVSQLSKESCIFLLSNWLLSLTMCDVSLFVTFELMLSCDTDVRTEYNQSVDSGGLYAFALDTIPSLPKAIVHYEINVIDYDPKPAKKLRNRHGVERLFQFCESKR
ncbi:hypothetical protein ACHAXN_007055 [Cyclotella atomus]